MMKYIYFFEEGNKDMKDLLGGKGAGLSEMTNIGLSVPPGFTITTEACKVYIKTGNFPEGLWDQVLESMKKLEEKAGKKFGDEKNPLLVSVRSGAPVSMPGMMDTVLNVGLNDKTVKGLAKKTNNERFAYDSYRRLIQMFGRIVLNVPGENFENAMDEIKKKYNAKNDIDLNTESLKELVEVYKKIIKDHGKEFPQDPYKQLELSIRAVFESWNNERAKVYRKLNNIPEDLGTAVSIVMMVFGNMGPDSATGVAFTRNPSTGEKVLFGEYLTNAQGEDVVAGIRTPKPIAEMEKEIPEAYRELVRSAEILEKHYRDVQDIEFTVEKGKFYLLQTRSAKRNARAAVKIAVDFFHEGIIDKEEMIMRVEPSTVDQLLHPQVDERAQKTLIAKGLAASPGAGIGKVVFDPDTAVILSQKGEKVILVRPETMADDVHGIAVAQGVLTSRGGMTSHAAVVARAMGKPAVVGSEEVKIDMKARIFQSRGFTVKELDVITVDGTTGSVYLGAVPVSVPGLSPELREFLKYCDEVRKLGIRANANTPEEASIAREFGAEGIGLARTERMFLGADRLPIMQAMIMSKTKEERVEHLNRLLDMQTKDFVEFFRIMDGFPVIIRLLDPPLHEFLPKHLELINDINELKMKLRESKTLKEMDAIIEEINEKDRILRTVMALEEFNPMIGFRGCRVGIIYPEIYEMQVRAIIRAAVKVKEEGKNVIPEIMIPLVGIEGEIRILRERLIPIAEEESKGRIKYMFGTMLEVPRGALVADKIAKHVDFFSFGTNDLTQMTFGFSRDDVEAIFMNKYLELGVLKDNPFEILDREGVGELMKIAKEKGRRGNPNLELGICGEHGGEPSSIEFCHIIGLDYVSASPYRIPIARLAAAQAAIRHKKDLNK
ncbi:MAG: pyruvate, phosphate dikinase [Thermoplasmata archaeon]|nr:MAG: pyruvate, phosphate dikinase [Aciduliprofundum sp.]